MIMTCSRFAQVTGLAAGQAIPFIFAAQLRRNVAASTWWCHGVATRGQQDSVEYVLSDFSIQLVLLMELQLGAK